MVKRADKPCERCGWKYNNFHVCIDLSDPTAREVVLTDKQKAKLAKDRHYAPRPITEEERKARSEAMLAVRAREREANMERDKEIALKYEEEQYSTRELAATYLLDQKTIMRILHRFRDAGLIRIRPSRRRPGALRTI